MMRILVVEDEKLLCDGIAEDLELEKYTVERCYDGAEAYDLLLSESFDLLILDLNLPAAYPCRRWCRRRRPPRGPGR